MPRFEKQTWLLQVQGYQLDTDVLTVEIAHAADLTLVTVQGEIDLYSVRKLSSALEGIDASDSVLINMVRVPFMDSSGLSALAVTATRLRAGGGSLKICHASHAVIRVVELAGLDGLLDPHLVIGLR